MPATPRAFTRRDQTTTSSQRREMEAWGKRHYRKWEMSLNSGEREALLFYKGVGHQAINDFAREPKTMPKEVRAELEGAMRLLDESLAKAKTPQAVVAYRGTRGGWPPQVRAGDDLFDPGYVSSSLDISVAKDFAQWDSNPQASIVEIELSVGVNAA